MNKETLSAEVKKESLDTLIDFCHTHLFTPDGEQVLNYLRKARKLSDDTIRKFKLGVFPRYPDVAATAIGSYAAWKLGVVGFNEAGDTVSKFSTHNVMIPVFDQNDVSVAVIARSLLSEPKRQKLGLPKYTNTYYKKSNNLFGLNFAKNVIREKDEVILVEGNFDVITAHQNGLSNVVAISNSSLSKMQFLLAARYTRNVRLMLDNDEAGQTGTKRALEMFKDSSVAQITPISLPKGIKDIDEFFAKGHSVSELYNENI